MAYYLYQLSYSPEAIKSMVAKPSDREAAAAKLISAAGGKLHHLFFCFGKFDVACLIEAPDDATFMAAGMAVSASGTVSHAQTTKLFSAADAMAAMGNAGKLAGSYRPPMG